jgi:hypothetical protein
MADKVHYHPDIYSLGLVMKILNEACGHPTRAHT